MRDGSSLARSGNGLGLAVGAARESHPRRLIEHWALAVREDSVRPDFVQRQRALADAIARTLQARHATLGIPLAYPAKGLGTAIIALSLGLAMEALAEPDAVPDELLGDILGLIYDGLLYRAQQSP
jgi:hypothetical protein